jgi:hypothetical protein
MNYKRGSEIKLTLGLRELNKITGKHIPINPTDASTGCKSKSGDCLIIKRERLKNEQCVWIKYFTEIL